MDQSCINLKFCWATLPKSYAIYEQLHPMFLIDVIIYLLTKLDAGLALTSVSKIIQGYIHKKLMIIGRTIFFLTDNCSR